MLNFQFTYTITIDQNFRQVDGQNGIPEGMTVVAALQPQDIQLIQAQTEPDKSQKDATPVALIKSEGAKDDAQEAGTSITIPANYLQNTQTVHDYLQRIQNTTLPLSLQQFLKFNTDVKREQITEDGVIETIVETGDPEQETLIMNDMEAEIETEENVDDPDKNKKKKKYKKKPPKPKKPKPGQVSKKKLDLLFLQRFFVVL